MTSRMPFANHAGICAPSAETQASLQEIVTRFGTPTYAFDIECLRSQVEQLRTHLPDEVGILYSLKANASLGICDILAGCGVGADVASTGELATAIEAGFSAETIFVAGPFKSTETVDRLRQLPDAVISIDSLSEFRFLTGAGLTNRVTLRLRPDFGSCAVVPAGSESRFGFTCDALDECVSDLASSSLDVVGFHVFAGSQVLDTGRLADQLGRAFDLSIRAAETLGISPSLFNLGGGFGIPYGPADTDLDLASVGRKLSELINRPSPARIVLELGRFLVAEAGWYLTKVLGKQTFQGRPAVVVDGGVHQRADMCGLNLRSKAFPPTVLGSFAEEFRDTDVLGCLSLPNDVMIEACPLPTLEPGDVLAFPNAGAYGMWSSPAMFHGSPLPTEVAFDSSLHLMRERQSASSILREQHHVARARSEL